MLRLLTRKYLGLSTQHHSLSVSYPHKMATSPFFAPIHTIATQKPGVYIANSSHHKLLGTLKFGSVKTKAAGDNQKTKPGSLICADCDGNGAVLCSQCKGGGVNTVDHFNGQFKSGDSCWLCGGKKDVLCGNCNGAGFVGGFLSGFDH